MNSSKLRIQKFPPEITKTETQRFPSLPALPSFTLALTHISSLVCVDSLDHATSPNPSRKPFSSARSLSLDHVSPLLLPSTSQ